MKEKSFRQKCLEIGLDYNRALHYRYRHSELSDEQVIDYYNTKKNNKLKQVKYNYIANKSLHNNCISNNIDPNIANSYKYRHPHLTDEEVIKYFLFEYKPTKRVKSTEKSFKQKCEEVGISYKKAANYRAKYKNLTDEEVLNHYINAKTTIAEMCRQAGIVENNVNNYKRTHPDLTYEEVIQHYNPYCYYNITGDFIIVPLQKE